MHREETAQKYFSFLYNQFPNISYGSSDSNDEFEGESDYYDHDQSESKAKPSKEKDKSPTPSPSECLSPPPTTRVAFKKNHKILKTIRTLTVYQERIDAKHFATHSSQGNCTRRGQNPFADCCYNENSLENEDTADGELCGPFLNCPVTHKTHDFESLHIARERSALIKDLERNRRSRPSSGLAVLSSRPLSAQRKAENGTIIPCRYCTNSSIFLNPDLWIEDYKKKVTYSKIPSIHKDRLKDRLEVWIANEETEDVVRRSRPSSVNQMNAARLIAMANQQQPWTIGEGFFTMDQPRRGKVMYDIATPDRPEMYGPVAIASLGGLYTSSKRVTMPPEPEVKNDLPMQNVNIMIPRSDKDFYTLENGLKVAWPSDNVRYYDDDTDPRITELLANAPFCPPRDESAKLQFALNSSNSNASKSARPTSSTQPKTSVSKRPGEIPKKATSLTNTPRKGMYGDTLSNTSTSVKPTESSSSSGASTAQAKPTRPTTPSGKGDSNAAAAETVKVNGKMDAVGIISNGRNADTKPPMTFSFGKLKQTPPGRPGSRESLHVVTPPLMANKKKSRKLTGKKKKSKLIRRFEQSISTVSLGVPKSKYSSGGME